MQKMLKELKKGEMFVDGYGEKHILRGIVGKAAVVEYAETKRRGVMFADSVVTVIEG